MFKLLPILCLAFVVVSAYDFSDTYFNQYLFDEYEYLNSNMLTRRRRDVSELDKDTKADDDLDDKFPCGGGRFHDYKKDLTCCEVNKHDPNYFSMIRETKKQCAVKLRANNPDVENFDPFNCEHMDKIKELIICESECVAKTLEMLDENGDIKRDVIIANYNKQLAKDTEIQHEVLEGYVDKCLAKLKEMDLKPANKCSRAPMELQHCLFGEMVSGCPKESQINNHRCQKIRERYSKGQSLAFGKHTLHDFLHHGRPGRHGHH
ncbi:uncharacterized protein LOC106094366 [Stomoxys calcitrans]|uniref:Uncharacterized protein n=1 Tax=Stomoxys calcitrans TaxID=35570 RepID=A0A1I8Q0Z4_STOCA|nr:uncharacterized protein LOC106094366 [Stomoxys calcitrans]